MKKVKQFKLNIKPDEKIVKQEDQRIIHAQKRDCLRRIQLVWRQPHKQCSGPSPRKGTLP